MRIAIYSRKSVYTGKGESIENQIEMCKQYIYSKINGATENDITVYEDEGFSAKNLERPQFQKMLKDIKQMHFDYIVCYRLDRISRNVSDFATLIEDLNDRSISFICIKEEFDTSKPMGKAMMYIASVFAQLERETIAERVRDNMFMLARTGRWLGGTPPTGFTSEKVEEIFIDGRVRTACKLKYDINEITIVKTMYDKFLESHSVSSVSKHLIKNSIKSRTGKFYSLIGIKQILENPVYCIADKDSLDYFIGHDSDVCFDEKDCSDKLGILSYNKRDYKKKHAPRQEKSEWIIAIGKHKGIVTGKQWVTAQNMLEANKPTNHQVKMHNDYSLMSGMVFCSKCGNRMFAKIRRNNTELFDYICSSKMRGGMNLCDGQNLNGRQADDMVCEYLMQYTNENSNIYKLLEKLKKDLQSQVNINPLDEINARINKCNAEMDNLINTLSQSNLGAAFVQRVNAKISELDKELEQLTAEKNRLQSSVSQISDKEIQLDMIASTLSSLKSNFEILTIHERRTLVKLLIQKIEWDGKDLHIFIYGE